MARAPGKKPSQTPLLVGRGNPQDMDIKVFFFGEGWLCMVDFKLPPK